MTLLLTTLYPLIFPLLLGANLLLHVLFVSRPAAKQPPSSRLVCSPLSPPPPPLPDCHSQGDCLVTSESEYKLGSGVQGMFDKHALPFADYD